jgi:hypothetical protein
VRSSHSISFFSRSSWRSVWKSFAAGVTENIGATTPDGHLDEGLQILELGNLLWIRASTLPRERQRATPVAASRTGCQPTGRREDKDDQGIVTEGSSRESYYQWVSVQLVCFILVRLRQLEVAPSFSICNNPIMINANAHQPHVAATTMAV